MKEILGAPWSVAHRPGHAYPEREGFYITADPAMAAFHHVAVTGERLVSLYGIERVRLVAHLLAAAPEMHDALTRLLGILRDDKQDSLADAVAQAQDALHKALGAEQ